MPPSSPPAPRTRLARCFLVIALLSSAANEALAAAQVDLPRKKEADKARKSTGSKDSKPVPRGGDLVPHLTCTVCLTPNYTTPIDSRAEKGFQTAWCGVCRTPRLHRRPLEASSTATVDLPESGTSGKSAGGTGEAGVPLESPGLPVSEAPLSEDPERLRAATASYFDAVARVSDIDSAVAVQALENLAMIGNPARRAARFALVSDHAPTVMLAVRLLLRSPVPEDRDMVVERLRHRLPTPVAVAAVDELTTLDPVRAKPAFLTELLAHPQAPVRSAAEKQLAKGLTPEHIELLEPQLESSNKDARMRALGLVSTLDDPRVLDLIMARVDDPNARVAGRAIEYLAKRDDPEIEMRLLASAFEGPWLLRRNAYALLALVERERGRLEPILGEAHVPDLLSGLDSNDPFVAGACATALAQIGFRSERPRATPWLDRAVPDRLVATVAGHVFFNDFSSLEGPALRSLEAISGMRHGADGPAWAEWWIEAREGFHASRATLALKEGDADSLEVSFREGGNGGDAFHLLAPAAEALVAPTAEVELGFGEQVYLTSGEALEFVELMQREGLAGAAVLPGQRGTFASEGRSLEIRIAGQSKSFAFGTDSSEPWFERAVGMARALRDRNRWQRFPDPEQFPNRRVFWSREADWWATQDDELLRHRRLEELVIARMQALSPGERGPCIAELRRLEVNGAPQAEGLSEEHFTVLVQMLDQERYFGDRARRLLQVAQMAGDVRLPANNPTATLDEVARGRIEPLIDVLVRRFGSDAAEPLAHLLALAGPERAREAGRDSRDVLRAVAAPVLAKNLGPEDTKLLVELLRDSNQAVEISAVMALGNERVEAGRTELLVRARIGTPLVRAAALRAVGTLGGSNVIDALTVALTDPDPELKLAAAEGLAAHDDPRSIPMLVTLLRQGRHASWYPAVRAGLIRRGESAHNALRSMLNAPGVEVRREAALLLSEQGRYEVVPDLIRVLTEDRDDEGVAAELAIATCVDLRASEDPARAWWDWWDAVRQDEPVAWFRAALEQEGWAAPEPQEFAAALEDGHGWDDDTVMLLLEVVRRAPEALAQRARRELAAGLQRDLPQLPGAGPDRMAWVDAVEELALRSRE